ncbi:MAG: hypothetical protein IKT58_07040 [Oscillospiraceae bacterium]|nr:hypothetical protein [Oscillospiraceae bacterium]
MWILVAILTALGGTALHFLYDILPTPLTALISPVNESVWEHLKLLFWPMLIGAAVLAEKSRKKTRLWSSFFVALLFTPAFLLLCFYGLKAIGFESTALDITLYYISMFAGYFLAWFLYKHGKPERCGGYLLMLVILYGACLILFTFAPPDLPIFREIPM